MKDEFKLNKKMCFATLDEILPFEHKSTAAALVGIYNPFAYHMRDNNRFGSIMHPALVKKLNGISPAIDLILRYGMGTDCIPFIAIGQHHPLINNPGYGVTSDQVYAGGLAHYLAGKIAQINQDNDSESPNYHALRLITRASGDVRKTLTFVLPESQQRYILHELSDLAKIKAPK